MKQFFFFGDSVTLGVCDPAAGGWPARLAGLLGRAGIALPPDTFYNLGVRRNSSRSVMARWEAEFRARALENAQARLLFCFGTVDMAAPKGTVNVPVGESAANARDILLKAAAEGPAVLVSAPPVANAEHNGRLDALRTAYASVCAAAGIPFADIFTPLSQNGYADTLADGIHPNPEGSQMIAEALMASPVIRAWC